MLMATSSLQAMSRANHHSIPHAAAADAGEKLGSCPCEPSCACMPSLPEHRIALCQNHTMGFAAATFLLGKIMSAAALMMQVYVCGLMHCLYEQQNKMQKR